MSLTAAGFQDTVRNEEHLGQRQEHLGHHQEHLRQRQEHLRQLAGGVAAQPAGWSHLVRFDRDSGGTTDWNWRMITRYGCLAGCPAAYWVS